jgi:hypothetical protein
MRTSAGWSRIASSVAWNGSRLPTSRLANPAIASSINHCRVLSSRTAAFGGAAWAGDAGMSSRTGRERPRAAHAWACSASCIAPWTAERATASAAKWRSMNSLRPMPATALASASPSGVPWKERCRVGEGLEVGAREPAEAGHERLVEAGEHGSGVRHGFGDGAEVAQGHQRTNQAISGRGAATGERWMYCR